MNRSLLLIVCDFLLLSLLALADFERTGQAVASERTVPATEEVRDDFEEESAIAGLLAAALSAEQTAQAEIQRELERAREKAEAVAAEQAALRETIREREESLREQEERLARARAEAAESAAEANEAAKRAERLATEKAAVEKRAETAARERERLAGEKEALERKTSDLTDRVERLSGTAEANQEELRRRSEELERVRAELDARSRRLAEAEQRQREAESARQRLAGEVEAARREKEILTSNLASARETIEAERQERTELRRQTDTLTEGVSRLAEASDEITKEVRGLRPLTANEIFRKVDANRITFVFSGARSGLFGESEFEEKVDAALTRINGRDFLWLHVSRTPFDDPERRRFLVSLDLFIEANGVRFRVPQMGVLAADPRLLFLPLTPETTERLGVEGFEATTDPFRFEDLVVVDLPESRFGDSGFRVRSDASDFVEIDNRAFSALFGEFSPAAGDLAFTRAGEFLGVVVRPGEAWIASDVRSGGRISFGEGFSRAQFGALGQR